jgi:2-hydroxy-3-keto-5-methylthiopentenyl-1-phosphate phosphatase
MEAKYIGPDGNQLTDDFKEAYIKLFQGKGLRVIYIGNGISDIYAARRAHHVFATDELLDSCKEMNIKYTPFDDLHDVIRGLELL